MTKFLNILKKEAGAKGKAFSFLTGPGAGLLAGGVTALGISAPKRRAKKQELARRGILDTSSYDKKTFDLGRAITPGGMLGGGSVE
jgi:hypothetical protein